MDYFTSDLHINHLNIIGFCHRPFYTVEEMNQTLIDNINEMVSPDDTLWILGDFAMGRREDSLEYLEQLQGNIIWVPGNHDYWHQMHSEAIIAKWRPIYEQYATLGDTVMELDEFVLCHFPYWDVSRHDGRYSAWLPDFDGRWLLHGHLHSMDAWDPDRPHCYDVGVDSHNYMPVSIDDIRDDIKLYSALEESHGKTTNNLKEVLGSRASQGPKP